MLRGTTELNLDAKGRMALPAKQREAVKKDYDSGDMLLTINVQERCLWLYPLEEWEKVEQKLVGLSSLDKNLTQMKRLLLGHANECSLDGQGRIPVPAFLRDYAKLGKRLAVVGLGNKFEIWDAEVFQAQRDQWIDNQVALGDLDVAMPDLPL